MATLNVDWRTKETPDENEPGQTRGLRLFEMRGRLIYAIRSTGGRHAEIIAADTRLVDVAAERGLPDD